MNPAEQQAILRARLRSIQNRVETSEVLLGMVAGQLRRQRSELAAAMELLTGAGAPGAVTISNQQPSNPNEQ